MTQPCSATSVPVHLDIAARFLPSSLRHPIDPPHSDRRLILPSPEHHPTFEEVARIATIAALFQQAVCVLCLNRGVTEAWRRYTIPLGIEAANLDLLDYRDAQPAAWQAFLADKPRDLVVLHGAEAELHAGRLTPKMLLRLVQATNAALVMVA